MAEVCELFYWLSSSDTGYSLRVSGFDHRLLALATEFLKTFLSFRDREGARDGLPEVVKEGRFEQCREILMRSYSNAGSKSSQRCSNARLRCLRPTIWSDYSKLEVLKKITVESFTDTMTLILEKVIYSRFLFVRVLSFVLLTTGKWIVRLLLSHSCLWKVYTTEIAMRRMLKMLQNYSKYILGPRGKEG